MKNSRDVLSLFPMTRRLIQPADPTANGGGVVDPEFDGDDLTPDEVAQAEVGDLITIQGDQFNEVKWSIWRHRTRQEMAQDQEGQTLEWVCEHFGPLSGGDLVLTIGGGTFNFRGYVPRDDGRGVRLKYNRTIALAGPRKDFSAVATSPVPAAAPNTDALTRYLERMEARLDRLERTPPAPTGPAASMRELAETMQILHAMGNPSRGGPDPIEIAKMFVEATRDGISIGQAREPIPADAEPRGTDWLAILEKVGPILDRVFTVAASRRVAPAPRPAPRPTPPGGPSHAEVVDNSQPATAAPTDPPEVVTPEDELGRARMMTLIDSLARAITNRAEPADFADTVEDLLTDDQLAMILSGPPDAVIAELTAMQVRYPVLGTDAAKAFIGAVLNELRTPAEPDAEA